MENLTRLAELLKARNTIDNEIAALVGRPVHKGHVGEYIAATIFGINLHEAATHKGSDGHFISGPLAGRTVNVKLYGKHTSQLDVILNGPPDDYLVLTGPKSAPVSTRGMIAPWVIEYAFLFDARELIARLQTRGVKIGIATSVTNQLWDEAEMFPNQRNRRLVLSDEQRALLRLFQQELKASAALSS